MFSLCCRATEKSVGNPGERHSSSQDECRRQREPEHRALLRWGHGAPVLCRCGWYEHTWILLIAVLTSYKY